MSEIAKLTDNEDTFGETADEYLEGWRGYAINTEANPPHTTLSYGESDTHGE